MMGFSARSSGLSGCQAASFNRLGARVFKTRTASESLTPFPDRICDACSSYLAIYDYNRQLSLICCVGNLYDFDRIANVVIQNLRV
jgi:hypothetical protein